MSKKIALFIVIAMLFSVVTTVNVIAAPAKKSQLVVAIPGNPTTFDPHGKNDGASMAIRRQMYEGLVIADPNFNISPCLATSWDFVDDTTIVFHLRKGVKFHDGTEMTADDVAYSLKRAFDGNYATPYMAAFDFEKSQVVDRYTYKLALKYPSGTVLLVLAYPSVGITSKAAVTALGKNTTTSCPGTGPYKFVKWNQGDSVELAKFNGYWGQSEGADNLLLRIISETSSRVVEVETGGVDIAYDVSSTDVNRYKNDKNLTAYRKINTTMVYIGMVTTKAPFTDIRVRQAVAHCVNQADLAKLVWAGQGSPATSVVCDSLYGYSKDAKLLSYDPELAKKLLAQAGYPNGIKTKIWVRDQQIFSDAAEVVRNQLAKGGIDAEVKVIEWASLLKSVEKAELDIYIMSLGVATGDAGDGLYRYFFSGSPFSSNTAFYKSAKFDDIVNAANREMNVQKRLKLVADAQQFVINEAPWVPVLNSESLFLANSKVVNFELYPHTYQYFKDVYVTK